MALVLLFMYVVFVIGVWDLILGFVNTLLWNYSNGFGIEDNEHARWKVFFRTPRRRLLFALFWPVMVPIYLLYWYRQPR